MISCIGLDILYDFLFWAWYNILFLYWAWYNLWLPVLGLILYMISCRGLWYYIWFGLDIIHDFLYWAWYYILFPVLGSTNIWFPVSCSSRCVNASHSPPKLITSFKMRPIADLFNIAGRFSGHLVLYCVSTQIHSIHTRTYAEIWRFRRGHYRPGRQDHVAAYVSCHKFLP